MIWYREFYAGKSIARKKGKIKWEILHQVGQMDIYVITLSSNPENLLDIIPSWELMQKYYPRSELFVVGIDKGYENALELAGNIVLDVYHKTGNFKIRDYFIEKHNNNPKKGFLWKS